MSHVVNELRTLASQFEVVMEAMRPFAEQANALVGLDACQEDDVLALDIGVGDLRRIRLVYGLLGGFDGLEES